MEPMERFQNSAIAGGLRLIWDLIVINWLWLLCCLPVITIGPAICALFAVTQKIARNEPVSLVKDFISALASNFGHGIVLGAIVASTIVVAAVDTYFAMQQVGLFKVVFLVVATVVASTGLTFLVYVFSLQARFENTLKMHIRNGFILAFCSPGRTVLSWILCIFPVVVAMIFPTIMIHGLGFLYIMMGVSLPGYCISQVLVKAIDKAERK